MNKLNDILEQADAVKYFLQDRVLKIKSELESDIELLEYHKSLTNDIEVLKVLDRNIAMNKKYLSYLVLDKLPQKERTVTTRFSHIDVAQLSKDLDKGR